ncbi:hypothetical protein TNCV_1760761 [Trichonephila clavipes]|nr:hypothetical protein TNCV_1760761 [Trichonephila clavipes]
MIARSIVSIKQICRLGCTVPKCSYFLKYVNWCHHVQFSEFERRCIVGFREVGWAITGVFERGGAPSESEQLVVSRCCQQRITKTTNNVAGTGSTQLTILQTSGGIKENHSQKTGRMHMELTTNKIQTDDPPHHKQCRYDSEDLGQARIRPTDT